MVAMASESKTAASKSTSNAAAPSRAGSRAASVAGSVDEDTPRPSHRAPWDLVASPPDPDRASEVGSEADSMAAVAVAGSAAAEAAVVSRTADRVAGEVSAIKVVDLVAAMAGGVIAIGDLAVVRLRQTRRLDQDPELDQPADTVRARQTAVDLLLGLLVVAARRTRTEGTEVVIVGMAARAEATTAVAAGATWSR